MNNSTYPLTLLYDAGCPVCALEMDHLRARNTAGHLVFIDISAPGFDPIPYGATLADMNAEIHAVRADGQLIHGIGVLRLAYQAVGLGWVLAPTAWRPLRPVFDHAYRLFARYRQPISRTFAPLILAVRENRARRTAHRMAQCQNKSQGPCPIGSCAKPHERPPSP